MGANSTEAEQRFDLALGQANDEFVLASPIDKIAKAIASGGLISGQVEDHS